LAFNNSLKKDSGIQNVKNKELIRENSHQKIGFAV